jgi:lysophospholipase L1-like esterase
VSRGKWIVVGVALVAAAIGIAAWLGSDSSPSATRAQARGQARGTEPVTGPKSIVQLGDSLASGEGTLYGYTYDKASRSWTGGDLNAKWPPPYPDCHVSGDEYGKKIAAAYSASFAQFACTGATFASGISAPETSGNKVLRPAEFGDWAAQKNLNADYDKAAPDLVLVTLGADDLGFVDIVENCVKNGYKYASYLAKLECVTKNPGDTIQKDFFDFLPTVKANYGKLVTWIQERAKKNGQPVPKIVFTNYPNPLPDSGVKCPDVSWLYPSQVDYLSSLLAQLNQAIVSTITGLKDKNVAVVDISKGYQAGAVDHRWCSDDPWPYGLSIYSFYHPSSFNSQAPFHPTPEGQKNVAGLVKPAVDALFKPS